MSARRPLAHPKKPRTWIAYRICGAKAAWLGHVEAPTMEAAISAAAREYGVPPSRILVQQVRYA
jgi:hypothetical protein